MSGILHPVGEGISPGPHIGREDGGGGGLDGGLALAHPVGGRGVPFGHCPGGDPGGLGILLKPP